MVNTRLEATDVPEGDTVDAAQPATQTAASSDADVALIPDAQPSTDRFDAVRRRLSGRPMRGRIGVTLLSIASIALIAGSVMFIASIVEAGATARIDRQRATLESELSDLLDDTLVRTLRVNDIAVYSESLDTAIAGVVESRQAIETIFAAVTKAADAGDIDAADGAIEKDLLPALDTARNAYEEFFASAARLGDTVDD